MSVEFHQHAPAPELAWCVQYYWTLSGCASADDMHPIFPDGSPELVFNLGAVVHEIGGNTRRDAITTAGDDTTGRLLPRHAQPRHAQPRAMFVGQMTRPILIEPTGALDMIGVRLAPLGAAALLIAPASTLRGTTASLDALGVPALCALPEQMRRHQTVHARLSLLEQCLRAVMRYTTGRLTHVGGRQLMALARAMHQSPPASVDRWSERTGCSARTLERHFDRFVGLAPKEFARIRRFQCALRLATERPAMHWSVVAAQTGYADQSHLVRDFRQFAGAAPTVVRPTLTEISVPFVDDTARVP